jgi:hypothetical protein
MTLWRIGSNSILLFSALLFARAIGFSQGTKSVSRSAASPRCGSLAAHYRRRKDPMNWIMFPSLKRNRNRSFRRSLAAAIVVTLGVPAVYLRMAFPPPLSD